MTYNVFSGKLNLTQSQPAAPCGAGHPYSPLSIYFIFSPFSTFPILSLALPIFFFCPSLLFLLE